MSLHRRLASVAVLLAVVVGLSACGDQASEPPDGAARLRENVPTTVDGVVLVAANVWDDSIVLTADDGDGAAEDAGIAVGERATLKGRTYELVSVHEDTSSSAPGGSGSYAWVLPVG